MTAKIPQTDALQRIKISNDNPYILRKKNYDILRVAGAVTSAITEILELSPSGVGRTERAYNDLLNRIGGKDTQALAEITAASVNRPPYGPILEIVTAYSDSGRVDLVSPSYARLNTHPTKSFAEIQNNTTSHEVQTYAQKVKKDNPHIPQEICLQVAQTKLALSAIWISEDVNRAIKNILTLNTQRKQTTTDDEPLGYQFVGQTRQSADKNQPQYFLSNTVSHASEHGGKDEFGSVRQMQDVTDAVNAFVQKTGKPYWEFRLEPNYSTYPKTIRDDRGNKIPGSAVPLMGDPIKSYQGLRNLIKTNANLVELGNKETEQNARIDCFLRDLLEVCAVGERLWAQGKILKALFGHRNLFLANTAFCQAIGYSPDELRAMSDDGHLSRIFANPKDVSKFNQMMQISGPFGHDFSELNLCTRDGYVITISAHVYSLSTGKVFLNARLHSESVKK